jgi:uncharacterized membrane protein YcaP (DUF421 family)
MTNRRRAKKPGRAVMTEVQPRERGMHAIDWEKVFVPTVSLLELVLRGSVMYLFILVAFRILRREVGEMEPADILVLVLIADAAQNGMASEYHSLPEAVVLVTTIFGWNFVLDWLAFRFEWAHRLLAAPPLLLIRNGRVMHRNLRREFLTIDDLKVHLRQQGVEAVTEVRRCYIEPNGKLSVLKRS